jgi:hypothetical protein
VSSVTVAKIAKQTGIDLAAAKAARAALPPEKRAQIIEALEANPNASAVAKQLGGVSHAMVWKIAKQTGIYLAVGRPARAESPARGGPSLNGCSLANRIVLFVDYARAAKAAA